MEGLSTELDFALRSRDPYPINLESLVDLLKYKHISSLTTHLKRHFQRDIDYKKFHQVRNKRQICVYYISVDCFKQICGFCRHTQRKEIAQNLLGTMGTDAKTTTADDMSFTDMLNDISELNHGDDSEEEDDFRMRQSSPPSKSIKTEKGSFVTKESLFNRYGRTQLQNNIAMMKRSGSFAETTPAPSFSNNIYNFNNLSAAHSITPIIPTPVPVISNKSTLTSSLAAPSFPSFNNPANALANAAISNTNNSAFAVNNNSNNTFNFSSPYPNFSFAPTTANTYFSPSTTSISSFSSNAATSHLNPVTNINTITPTNTVPITISNNNYTNNFTNPTFSTTLSSSTFSNNFSQDLLNTIPVTAIPTQQINNHKRTSSSRASPTPITTTTPSLSTSSIKPITHVTSTITPTPIITSSTSLANSTTTPITTPITATPIINTAITPSPFITPTSPATIRNTTTTTTTTVKPPVSPSMSKATILTPPPKPGVTKFFDFGNFTAKNNTYVNSFKNEPEFKVETDSTLFDLGLTACPDMQFYDDYLTLSSSPTSMFDPVNTLAEVDKIYEQWEQERGGPRLFDEYK